MEHSFHGRTAAAGAVTYGAAKSWYGFPRTPFDVAFVPRNDVVALAAAVDTSTAAVIIEPVQGLAGAFDFAPEFMHAVRAACDRAGALLIIDEVQTGMGRLGAPFGAQLYGVRPDLVRRRADAAQYRRGFEARRARHHVRRRPRRVRSHQNRHRRHQSRQFAR
jgi:acetylornithine/succinyldiaminopimelate/putrescine aminotransferase